MDRLSKRYPRRGRQPIMAVDDLSLRVEAGQVFGFLGHNGAGKTTAIKMLCGLVRPTSGSVRLNGYDVVRQRGKAMRQIGAVLEGTRNVYWRLSAWDNLMYFGRLKGCGGKETRGRAETLLRDLDLWDRRGDEVRTFSRGMQQKVAIACALVADPPIVVLDEPTLGLDVEASRSVQAWVQALARDRGKTVLLTTHQLSMAQAVCHRVAIMANGKLMANRPPGELLALFAGELYEIRIAGSLNGLGAAFDGFAITEDGRETVLRGPIDGHEALRCVLRKIDRLGLPIISTTRSDPDLEEVFMRISGSRSFARSPEANRSASP